MLRHNPSLWIPAFAGMTVFFLGHDLTSFLVVGHIPRDAYAGWLPANHPIFRIEKIF